MREASRESIVTQSTLVNALRFPLAVLVVFSHCVIIRDNVPASLSLAEDNVFLMVELFFRSLGTLAVAGFSVISGYYFFSKAESWTFTDYKVSVLKRVRSILIPYILWNLIAIGAVWIKNKIALAIGFTPGYSEVEMSFITQLPLWKLLIMPFCGPLWYLRELFYLTLLSPIIYWVIKRLGYWSILVAAVPYLFYQYIPTGVSSLILFFFVVGACLGVNKVPFARLLSQYRWLSLASIAFYSILVIFYNDSPLYTTAHSIALVGLLGAVIYWIEQCCHRVWIQQTLIKLSPSVFFIYAIHFIILINLVREGLYYLGVSDIPYGKTLVFFITGGIVTLLSYTLYRVWAWVEPRSLAVLCGGRIK